MTNERTDKVYGDGWPRVSITQMRERKQRGWADGRRQNSKTDGKEPTEHQCIQVSSLRRTGNSTKACLTEEAGDGTTVGNHTRANHINTLSISFQISHLYVLFFFLPRCDLLWFGFHPFTVSASYLRMQSRACVKTCGAMPCSCCRIRHCSRVTDMAVRSLALLQLVKRTPFSRRQI